MTYGYARVSSTDQNEDRQLIALRKAGVDEKHIFVDKASGKDFNRPAYQTMKSTVKEDQRAQILALAEEIAASVEEADRR